MLRCSHCDHFNSEDSTQCERCGAPLDTPGSDAGGDAAATGPADPFVEQVLKIATENGKIAAIKHYREATGSGLKDAKEAVESMMRQHKIIANAGPAGGCFGVVLAIGILPGLAGLAWAWIVTS